MKFETKYIKFASKKLQKSVIFKRSDIVWTSGATGIRIGHIMQNLVGMGVGLGIAFLASWQLSLLTLAFIPIVALAGE